MPDKNQTAEEAEEERIFEKELRAELAAKAEKAGIHVEDGWTASDIEEALAVAATSEEPPRPKSKKTRKDADAEKVPAPESEPEKTAEEAAAKAEASDPPADSEEEGDARDAEIADLKAMVKALLAAQQAPKAPEPLSYEDIKDELSPPRAAGDPEPKPTKGSIRHVKVRITKAGDGKVFTGNGNETFKWKDSPRLPLDTARALEARHFVEIEE